MRVLYWNTSCLEPKIEAVSKEVFQLAAHFPQSLVFGVSPHYVFRGSWRGRCVGFHPRFDPLLRVLIPFVERAGDINHVYGEPSPWIYHKTLRRNPLVLTVCSEKGALVPQFLDRCRTIVAQTEGFRDRLLNEGIGRARIALIYPGVDLERFRPSTRMPDPQRPRLLFASAPRSEAELGPRGVYLLLEAAGALPELHFRLLFRSWATGYSSLAPIRRHLENRRIANVELSDGAVPDMATVYPDFHFTVIPYTTPDGGKECPNSLVEGLACGVPVLISSVSPFSAFVARNACGIVFDPTAEGLGAAVARGMERWPQLSKAARAAAERHFCQRGMLRRYEEIYGACLRGARTP